MLCDPAQYLWNFCGLKRPGSDGKTEPGGEFPAGLCYKEEIRGRDRHYFVPFCFAFRPSLRRSVLFLIMK